MSDIDPFAKNPKVINSQLETENTDLDTVFLLTNKINPPPLPKKKHITRSVSVSETQITSPPITTNNTPIVTSNTTSSIATKISTSDTTSTTPSATQIITSIDTSSASPLVTTVVTPNAPSSTSIASSSVNSQTQHFQMATVALVVPLVPELGSDIAQFVLQCDILMSMLATQAEKNLLTTFIRVRLQSQPKIQKLVEAGEKTTWDEVKTTLNSIVKSARPVEDVQTELTTKTQKTSESVEKFGEEITRLLAELHKAYERELAPGEVFPPSLKTVLQRQAVKIFESGLRHEQLRLMVIMSKSATLSDAITNATALESRIPRKHATQSTNSPQTSASNTSDGPSSNSKPICSNCKKTGHTVTNCYQKPVKAEPVDQTANNFCRYCKTNGHVIADCAARKENNLRYRGNENYVPPRQVNHTQIPQPGPSADTPNQGNGGTRAGTEEIPARIVDLPEN